VQLNYYMLNIPIRLLFYGPLVVSIGGSFWLCHPSPKRDIWEGQVALQRQKTISYRRAEWIDDGVTAPPLESDS
jgi:hypothetical protein